MASDEAMPVVEALQVLAGARGPGDIVITNQASARVWPQISRHMCDLAYNPSAMGGAVPLALGLALAQPQRHVIVVSGDGALLMNLGCLVTVSGCGATNLTVVALDNGVYEVTGGQRIPGLQAGVDFCSMAIAAGFRSAARRAVLSDWQCEVSELLAAPGPRFIQLVVQRTPQEYFSMKGPPIREQLSRLSAALLGIKSGA